MPMTLKIKSDREFKHSQIEINGMPIAITALKLAGRVGEGWDADISFFIKDLDVEIDNIKWSSTADMINKINKRMTTE